MEPSFPLVRVRRGGHAESLHCGAVALWQDGRLRACLGDRERLTFYRSSSKPLQALVGVHLGTADALGLAPAELALAAGSHSGAPVHVAAARSILAKSGVPESALGCGGHWSIDVEVAYAQRREHPRAPAVLSNCSGKHALMLASARHLGASLDDYLSPAHPLQQRIRTDVAHFTGLAAERVAVSIDGCGAPTFAVPLQALARSVAGLARPEQAPGLPEAQVRAARRITAAMLAFPEMVAGEGRFDTELMRAGAGRWIAKGGAEGVHVVAVPHLGAGLVVKVDDGSDRGYRLVVIELLRRMGLLPADQAQSLGERQGQKTQKNVAGRAVGDLEVLLPSQFP